ncbi:MAG: hypothetical protein MRZ79_14170 [Bacteroidia bacterium]|nr:hypothetical protein [Bacteroidia bacterium]
MGKEPDLQGLLKSRFEKMELEPEIDLWPAIEEKIQKEPGFWKTWRPYLAVAACLAVLISVWIYTRKPEKLQTPIAEKTEKVENPVRKDQNIKRELASLERKRVDNSSKKNKDVKKANSSKKANNYIPSPRAGQSITLPIVEKQILASKYEDEEGKNNTANTKIKGMKESMVKGNELASLSPVKVNAELKPIKVKALESNKQLAIKKTNPNSMEINLNELTIKDAVVYATEKINETTEKMDLPVKVEQKQTKYGKKKTYQVQIFNVSFTRTTYRSNKAVRQL